jgi:hypothetical protein
MKIEVTQASIDEKPILKRLIELYAYDFSEYENSDVDPHGCFGYPFLVRVDGKREPLYRIVETPTFLFPCRYSLFFWTD